MEAWRTHHHTVGATGLADDLGRLIALYGAVPGRSLTDRLAAFRAFCDQRRTGAAPSAGDGLTDFAAIATEYCGGKIGQHKIPSVFASLVEAYRAAPELHEKSSTEIAKLARQGRTTTMKDPKARQNISALVSEIVTGLRMNEADQDRFVEMVDKAMAQKADVQTAIAEELTSLKKKQLSSRDARRAALLSWRASRARRSAERARHSEIIRQM